MEVVKQRPEVLNEKVEPDLHVSNVPKHLCYLLECSVNIIQVDFWG